MIIRRQLADLFTNMMDSYSNIMYNHRFDVDYKSAARFLAKNPQPELSQQDKDAIDNYWKKFGIKYPDYTWFQMFYGVTGMHDPRFIPDIFAYPPIFTHYNDKSCIAAWEDKNLFDQLIPAIKFPPVLAHIYKGNVYDKQWNYYSDDRLQQLCDSIFEEIRDHHSFILKPTKATHAGKNVRLITVDKPEDIMTAITQSRKFDCILQHRLQQSAFMEQFCSTSVNIFRVVTWRHKGKIEVLTVGIRYGLEGHHTDITYIDGEEIMNAVGVNHDGTVNKRFVTLSGNSHMPEHFHQEKIPNFDAVIDMAKRGHHYLHPFDVVGWDITLDQDNNPICIEYNLNRPGTKIYQFANGPLAGDLTDEFLGFLLRDDNLKKKFPAKYRI